MGRRVYTTELLRFFILRNSTTARQNPSMLIRLPLSESTGGCISVLLEAYLVHELPHRGLRGAYTWRNQLVRARCRYTFLEGLPHDNDKSEACQDLVILKIQITDIHGMFHQSHEPVAVPTLAVTDTRSPTPSVTPIGIAYAYCPNTGLSGISVKSWTQTQRRGTPTRKDAVDPPVPRQ